MMIVGLTGGIGSGKTTVAKLFAKYHVPIIDADEIARDLTQLNQPALKTIVEHFGQSILNKDGTLDRKQLRALVFKNITERRWLEALLHPLIKNEIEKKIKSLSADYCIVVIPLLIEVGSYPFIDRILVIDTDVDIQIKRVIERDHDIATNVKAMIETQIDSKERLTHADDVIVNRGSVEELVKQVGSLHEKYLQSSR